MSDAATTALPGAALSGNYDYLKIRRPPFKRQVGLEMGLSGFQIRPFSVPGIADFGRLNVPKRLQNQPKMVGRLPPNVDGFRSG